MDVTKQEQLCTCGSGRRFNECCGVEGRTALNAEIFAKLDDAGHVLQGELTEQLAAAVGQAATSPDIFFARYNFLEERAYVVKMTPQLYQDSVFLDPGRIKGTCVVEANFQWIESITDAITIHKTPFIFHTAFCGSTLMSQALQAAFNVLPLREPECLSNTLELFRSPLKTQAFKDHWLETVLKLLSKRYSPDTITLVKTNDYSNPMMSDIVDHYQQAPSLFMYTPLEEFVVSCLKDKSRQAWIKGRFQSTLAHTKEFFSETLHSKLQSLSDQDYAEMAAFYWSYNVSLFLNTWRKHPKRIHSLDFNDMLKDPMQCINACGDLFALEKSSNENVQEKMDALFGLYSKNSSKAYSPQQRREEIQQQLTAYSTEVEQAKQLANQLLKDNYPEAHLPGALINA